MSAGLVWVEAYLPLNVEAFAQYSDLVHELGSYAAANAADPALAEKALTPIDSHGEAMLAEDVEQLGRGFLESRRMDTEHDYVTNSDLTLVESFINGPEVESPHFYPGAWVVVFKAEPGTQTFDDINAGRLNAVSFATGVVKVPVTATAAKDDQ